MKERRAGSRRRSSNRSAPASSAKACRSAWMRSSRCVLPGAWQGCRRLAAPTGFRAVRRSRRGDFGNGVSARARRRPSPAARDPRRSAPRHRERRAVLALPAEGRHGDQAGAEPGGAGALESPAPWRHSTGRIRAAGRARRQHHPADQLGAEERPGTDAGLAQGWVRDRRVRQSLGGRPGRPRAAGPGAQAPQRGRRPLPAAWCSRSPRAP